MAPIHSVIILGHTTTSTPRPHVLYTIKVSLQNGDQYHVLRRYSQFMRLHESLRDSHAMPPKRILANAAFPAAWIDDQLISERKSGLMAYLDYLVAAPEFQAAPIFLEFLAQDSGEAFKSAMERRQPCMASRNMVLTHQATAETQAAPIAATYYPTWSAGNHPPNKLDFSKFDIIFFAFVTPSASSTLDWDSGSQDTLRNLIASARKSGKGTKIVLSIGGWGGSHWFSRAASSSENRAKLNNALVGAVNSFGLDGIDIDWEYPNSTGAGNPHLPSDAANFLSLLKLLRKSLGPSKIISAAVAHMPWLGPNGNPLSDVSAYAAQMSYVNIMNYDVWGASPKPGPNAPLGNHCGTSTQPHANAQAALAQWTRAGFPASKLLLGLPLYGYVSKSNQKKLSGSLMPDEDGVQTPRNARPWGPPENLSVAPAGDLSSMWGRQIAFSQLLSSGALKRNSDGTYVAANGFTMAWDDCSDTPFLYNVARTTVVTYDDTRSLADKARFAKRSGMAGCFTWSIDQDDGLALQNVIRTNLGKK